MTKLCFILIVDLGLYPLNAQNIIEPLDGYSPQIGVLVSMLEDMKNRVERTVEDMEIESIDYYFDENANSVGSIIMHLAATEAFYQAFTFENRELNQDEQAKWSTAQNLGDEAKERYKGKNVKEYLAEFDKVRERTLELFRTKDDTWLAEMTQSMNNHWAWYHVMEHQSSHLGQILLMKKRIPKI